MHCCLFLSTNYLFYFYPVFTRQLQVMLENCPQILLQVCAIMQDKDWLERLDDVITFSDVMRILSLLLSVVALPLALCADEEAGRFELTEYHKLLLKVQINRPPLTKYSSSSFARRFLAL